MYKKLCGLVLFSLLSVALAQTEVIWWDFLGGGDGVRMRAMIEEFNQSHPDIQITPTTLEWGETYYTRVQTAAAVGQGPDIMTYHLSRYPLAVEQGVLRPFSEDELASAGISRDTFTSSLIEAATFDDQLYGIPLDIHALILYYNRDILREVGLLAEDGTPQGIDSLEGFNAALQTVSEAGYLPLSFQTDNQSATVWRIFMTYLNQQGGSVVDGEEIAAGEAAVQTVEMMANWVEQGYARSNVEYEASVALFASGDTAFHYNGVWEVPTFTDLAEEEDFFDWGAMVVPALFDQPATWADSHTFAIPAGDISDEKLAAVLEVIAWMNENSLQWAGAGHVPAYLPVVESEAYQSLEPNATYAELINNAAYDPNSPLAGVAGPMYAASANFIAPSVNGQLPPNQAVQGFVEELNAQMR